jgi:hypothetical protein
MLQYGDSKETKRQLPRSCSRGLQNPAFTRKATITTYPGHPMRILAIATVALLMLAAGLQFYSAQ